MSDVDATAFPGQMMLECGICYETFNVVWFCKNCEGSLCDNCKQSHETTRLFKHHLVVPRTLEVLRLHGPAKIAEVCPVHPTKELYTYCNDCRVACCVLCHHQKHKYHSFTPIEEKYLSAEKKLNEYTEELENEVKPLLDSMERRFKKSFEKNEVQTEKVQKEINKFRRTLIHKVDQSCDLLLKELDKTKVHFMDAQYKLDRSKRKVDNQISDINIIIGKGKLDMVEYLPPHRASLVPQLPLSVFRLPRFTPEKSLIETIQNKVGKLEFEIEIPKDPKKKTSQTGRPLPPVVNEKKCAHQDEGIGTDDIKITKVKSFKIKIKATSLNFAGYTSVWVMHYDSSVMYLYDCNGRIVRSDEVKSCDGLNDMVITRSGGMIVSCQDDRVRYVPVMGEVSILINVVLYSPAGVCLTDQEEIVVCMREHHITVYSLDGRRKLREIRGLDSQGKPQITNPYRVVCNGKDLCVVNWRSNIVCVDESDSLRWMYDGKESKFERSFDPHGICVDKYHNLLVTDTNSHCVHYIDREGGLIQVILTQEQTGLNFPWGICVDDEKDQVWVGDITGEVIICEYLR